MSSQSLMLTPANGHHNGHHQYNGSLNLDPGLSCSNWSLAVSPPPTQEAVDTIVRPRNIVERARLNVA